jgi:hypothetical protein
LVTIATTLPNGAGRCRLRRDGHACDLRLDCEGLDPNGFILGRGRHIIMYTKLNVGLIMTEAGAEFGGLT